MEKILSNIVNFSDVPPEIQQYIAAYLNNSTLTFFAQSNKQILKNILPLLFKLKTRFSLQLTANGSSTYLYQSNLVWACGSDQEYQLGLANDDVASYAIFTAVPWPEVRGKIKQIIAGVNHTLILTEDNCLWVCGDNGCGQLGLGDKRHRSTFTAVKWLAEQGQIQQVITGWNHTVILTNFNRLWVCGDNEDGQLGLGDNENRCTFMPVKKLPKKLNKLLTLDNILNQLIKLGTSLTPTSSIDSNTHHSQYQSDESEGQPPLKAMRL